MRIATLCEILVVAGVSAGAADLRLVEAETNQDAAALRSL